MHGMVNRAIERFVRDTYRPDTWLKIIRGLGLDFTEFEPMLIYDAELTDRVLDALSTHLQKDRDDILEDIGTYLVSHPKTEAIRRLMRFGGVNFHDFLRSLDDLPERARLAVPDLHLPEMELREHTISSFSLSVRSADMGMFGFGHVVMGLLRAMADDYGALVLLDHKGCNARTEILEIQLADATFTTGRDFELGAGLDA